MVGCVSSGLRDQTDKLVLANFATAAWVGYYSVAARLAFLVTEIARFFYVPLMTACGAMQASGNWVGVRRLYANMMVFVGVAAGATVVVVAGLHDRLIVLWMGRPYPQSGRMLLLLIGGNACAVMLTGPGTAICRAIGKVWVETAYVCINLFGNLILTIVLVLTIGPIGTVIASGSTWAVSAIAFSFILHRFVDLPTEPTIKARWLVVLATVCAAGTLLLSNSVPRAVHRIDALVSFVCLGALSACVFVTLAVTTGIVPKAAFRGMLSSIVKRAKKLRHS
jgi:O-antigen/teichoic acid export membrane protein